ncbi:hypothetical protein BT96DRAFT_1063424, partial [Gymnopus androsaceus JB14]
PFASVIGTNHVPTNSELKKLKALLVYPQHGLSCLETEIGRVQTLLNDLWLEKQAIASYIEAHRALTSPVRQIPPGTLAEIFVLCLPTTWPSEIWVYTALSHRDLSVLENVALNILLWNSLHVHLPVQLNCEA